MTSYAESVLQPNEKVIIVGRLHWIVYSPAIFVLVLGFLLPFVVTDDYEFFATLGATCSYCTGLCYSYTRGLIDGSRSLQ